jgi:hypothetical protein
MEWTTDTTKLGQQWLYPVLLDVDEAGEVTQLKVGCKNFVVV